MKEEFTRTAGIIGEKAVEKLNNSSVCVFGLGGVGSFSVEALARVGVGSLTLVDGDCVTPSNINRQLFALHSTVGKSKAEVARERVLDIFPECSVKIIPEFVTPNNASEFFREKYDFCIDAIDDTDAKTAIALECASQDIPLIASMGTGFKLDPTLFRISDIKKTEICPLCRVMRKKYRDVGVESVDVLWSPERPVHPEASSFSADGRHAPASISFVPSVAGLELAGFVIKKLIGD